MKKVLLSVLFLATMSMSAQETEFESPFSKGSVTIGGSFVTNNSENELDNGDFSKNKIFHISPSIGYFIKDNLVVGLTGRYTRVKQIRSVNGVKTTNENDNYGVGVFAEKYYKVYRSFFLSFAGGVNYFNNDNVGVSSASYNLSITPSISCVINKHMSIKVGFDNILGYTYSTYENITGSGSSNVFTTDLGNSDLSVGFRYFF